MRVQYLAYPCINVGHSNSNAFSSISSSFVASFSSDGLKVTASILSAGQTGGEQKQPVHPSANTWERHTERHTHRERDRGRERLIPQLSACGGSTPNDGCIHTYSQVLYQRCGLEVVASDVVMTSSLWQH